MKKIILFVDDSVESEMAEKVFKELDISYATIPSVGPGTPIAEYSGSVFSGLRAIILLLRNINKLPASVVRQKYLYI